MSLFRNLFFTALIAGTLAGLAFSAIQHFTTVPLIMQAETYEVAEPAPAEDHAAAGHVHEAEDWGPEDGFQRIAFTTLANIISSIGFALVLVTVSELRGGINSWREGLIWGLAGFAVFTLAPSLGLPPKMPTMPAAPLEQAQVWWWAAAAFTAAGLAMIAFGRNALMAVLGIAVVVAPHLFGAPLPENFDSLLPRAMEMRFITAVVVTSFVFWVLAGGLIGYLRPRLNAA